MRYINTCNIMLNLIWSVAFLNILYKFFVYFIYFYIILSIQVLNRVIVKHFQFYWNFVWLKYSFDKLIFWTSFSISQQKYRTELSCRKICRNGRRQTWRWFAENDLPKMMICTRLVEFVGKVQCMDEIINGANSPYENGQFDVSVTHE